MILFISRKNKERGGGDPKYVGPTRAGGGGGGRGGGSG